MIDLKTSSDRDFLLVLAGSFSEAIERKLDIDLAHEGFWTRFVNFLSRTQVKIDGFDFETGVPGTDIGLNVKTSLKDEPSFRWRLREKVAARLGELRNEVYQFFDFGRDKIRQVKGDCGVVFIFDQFEQLRDTHDTQGRVAESVATLIANHSADLSVRSLHMIFTLPPWLKFRLPALRGIRLLYDIHPLIRDHVLEILNREKKANGN